MREDRGNAVVEFALVAPLLFMLLFGLVDFGQTFDAWLVSTNAAREGARYGAIYASEDYLTAAQVQQMAQEKAYDYLTNGFGNRTDVTYSLSDITVTVPSKEPGQPVTVSVAVQVQLWALTPFVPLNDPTVNAQATMRI